MAEERAMMSFSVALQQTQLASFWGRPKREDEYDKRAARASCHEVRAEAVLVLRRSGRPVSYIELCRALDISIQKMRGAMDPLVLRGVVRRSVVHNRGYLALVADVTPELLALPGRMSSLNERRARQSQSAIVGAVKNGATTLCQVREMTGLCAATVSKHVTALREMGQLVATGQPNNLRLFLGKGA